MNTDLGSYCCRESDLVNNTITEAESMCVTEAVIFKTVRCARAVRRRMVPALNGH